MQIPHQGSLPAHIVNELDARNGRVNELEATKG